MNSISKIEFNYRFVLRVYVYLFLHTMCILYICAKINCE